MAAPAPPRFSVATPFTWAGGIALLGAAVWLPGVIAIIRAIGRFFP